ncbi:suppressor of fused domain protein [Bacillus mycoides]|nr:suppressor of fused domain protein [Bacillus mycoides]MDI6533855.1 suppressor of fused domain protein [Bacillus mycoides]
MFFVPPFLWEDQLKTMDFPDKKVAWLLAVPISKKEYLFAQ